MEEHDLTPLVAMFRKVNQVTHKYLNRRKDYQI